MDVCDFCSSSAVVIRFPCRDFDSESEKAGVIYPSTREANTQTNLVLASHGFWAACEECRLLVEAHDIDGLVKRALGTYEAEVGQRHPNHEELEQHLWRTYALFFRNRIETTGSSSSG